MHRSESPETLITMETEQPNLPGAVVINTRWDTHTHNYQHTLNKPKTRSPLVVEAS